MAADSRTSRPQCSEGVVDPGQPSSRIRRAHAGGFFLVSRLVMSVIEATVRCASLCEGLRSKSITLRRAFINQEMDL
ncbi:hypothetical protein [Nonomuraea sp. NEAU-A123]|uniref:hypothetical protein n=1 Tax=Nonomuraea sp. NEAU-A123 TaxID=2839649 RepID=UPI001BE4B003|nr:hypothetical protein [Nonomuraea sp. NEAU-A123]MBT2225142.1 hypothetical protein [Nonomuraea sp. NEAU-A123]